MDHEIAANAASFDDVLEKETEHIAAARKALPDGGAFDGFPSSGLALSGGGIRSATFNLGVLQALAEVGKLARFDYLSTVSGGGYIGGWLTAWIHRKGLWYVETALADSVNGNGSEADEVHWLRAHSNFLTPRKGVLSLDVLWGIMTYVRNLATNQLLLATTIVAFMVGGAFVNLKLAAFASEHTWEAWLIGAVAVLLLASPFVGFEIASLRGQSPRAGFCNKIVCDARRLKCYWLIPFAIVIGGATMGYALAESGSTVLDHGLWRWLRVAVFPAFWLLAAICVPIFFTAAQDTASSSNIRASRGDWGDWVVWISVSTVVYAIVEASFVHFLRPSVDAHRWLTPLFAPLIYIGALEIGTFFLILLGGRLLRPYVHDWLSRMAAMILRIGIVPLAIFASWALLLPTVDYLAQVRWTLPSAVTAWLASTVFGVLGGKSAATGSERSNVWLERALVVTPYIFLLGLFALLVWSTREFLLAFMAYHPDPNLVRPSTWNAAFHANVALLERIPDRVWGGAAAFVGLLTVILAWRIDINLFSFHAYYRNRIAQAYLGASARMRRANLVTGYSAEDSPTLVDLETMQGGAKIRPYPIINTALNLSGRTRMEWQQRKAASFVFTPLYCGYELPAPLSLNLDPAECYPHAEASSGTAVFGHRRTRDFLRNEKSRRISQSLAVAISGAAASPNMGYHTSSSLAALMTAFNVRLGWWMPNSRLEGPWKNGGPDWSIWYIMKELSASANELSNFVYLSDGGHFENLGVYELLRRRCKLIVASDASADPKFVFDDLANLVHKARADLDIEIELDTSTLRPQIAASGVIGPSVSSYTVATIRYPVDASGDLSTGCLVYIKSSLPTRLPADVENYRESEPGFPHQATSDQWFDESQFEAYRRLGLEIGRTMCKKLPRDLEASIAW